MTESPKLVPLSPRQQALVASAAPWVRDIAKLVAYRTGGRLDDLMSAGNEALVRAALRFDPDAGFTFQAFAFKRLQGAMIRVAFAESVSAKALQRVLGAAERDAALASAGEPAPVSHSSGWDRMRDRACALALAGATTEAADLLEDVQWKKYAVSTVQRLLDGLPEDQRRVVEAFYVEDLTIDQAAAKLNTSRSTVRRLHDKVKQRLHSSLTAAGVTSL